MEINIEAMRAGYRECERGPDSHSHAACLGRALDAALPLIAGAVLDNAGKTCRGIATAYALVDTTPVRQAAALECEKWVRALAGDAA